jgi:lipopolysaccharide/colanic/teichoic acid biosynthesis glycosyltransferase
MLFDRERGAQAVQALVDGLIAGVSFVLASAIQVSGSLQGSAALVPTPVDGDVYPAAGLAAVLAPFVLRRCGAYTGCRLQPPEHRLWVVLLGTPLGAAVLLGSGFAFRIPSLSVGVVGLYGAIQLVALAALRITRCIVFRKVRRRRPDAGNFVLIGSEAQVMAEEIAANPGWGLRNLGFLDDEPRRHHVEALGDRYLGKTKELSNLFSREVVDEVIVALPREHLYSEATAELMNLCEAVGVDVTIVSDLFRMRRARPHLHNLLGIPGVTLANYPHRSLWALATKRAIDIVGAMVGILITAPLFLLVALAIKLDSPGPVFFVQRRCGLRGRVFPFVKFRSMYTGAEAQLEELHAQNEVSGPVFKMEKDPRVTRVGRVLRKSSIDELPQLVNVLAGHLSSYHVSREVGNIYTQLLARRAYQRATGATASSSDPFPPICGSVSLRGLTSRTQRGATTARADQTTFLLRDSGRDRASRRSRAEFRGQWALHSDESDDPGRPPGRDPDSCSERCARDDPARHRGTPVPLAQPDVRACPRWARLPDPPRTRCVLRVDRTRADPPG